VSLSDYRIAVLAGGATPKPHVVHLKGVPKSLMGTDNPIPLVSPSDYQNLLLVRADTLLSLDYGRLAAAHEQNAIASNTAVTVPTSIINDRSPYGVVTSSPAHPQHIQYIEE
jgi:hypothetical protein